MSKPDTNNLLHRVGASDLTYVDFDAPPIPGAAKTDRWSILEAVSNSNKELNGSAHDGPGDAATHAANDAPAFENNTAGQSEGGSPAAVNGHPVRVDGIAAPQVQPAPAPSHPEAAAPFSSSSSSPPAPAVAEPADQPAPLNGAPFAAAPQPEAPAEHAAFLAPEPAPAPIDKVQGMSAAPAPQSFDHQPSGPFASTPAAAPQEAASQQDVNGLFAGATPSEAPSRNAVGEGPADVGAQQAQPRKFLFRRTQPAEAQPPANDQKDQSLKSIFDRLG